ncbi:MAG: response regulator transcription factor [Desulfobulbus sp.]|jgi:DNA-binding NarL/FixJ family response regulator|uniref:response regulator transcription factor n=1 Tax=Desulfobulbus sp. TaxID=895 RepID=UPI00285115E7|nr:response regulator transcription factor [Desulfobulbus sp.]MDR2550802.1 response regulator transcription factor [Desulfobulbus sp.]
MNLILCCGNIGLRERWAAPLRTMFTVYQTGTLQDLRILVGQGVSFDLLFVHRALIDREIVAYIRERQPACKLFILSDRPDDTEGLGFLRQGVVGYANSYINPDRLLEAARAIASGSVWINQQLMQRLIAESVPAAAPEGGRESKDNPARQLANLSNREYQIAGLVAEGLANLEIAEQLGITERTVKAHLGAVYTKTAIRSRLGLALLFNKKKPA